MTLTPEQSSLMERVTISLAFEYELSPDMILDSRRRSWKQTCYARAVVVAGRELGLNHRQIAAFVGLSYTTIIKLEQSACAGQIAAGVAAADEVREAGHEQTD